MGKYFSVTFELKELLRLLSQEYQLDDSWELDELIVETERGETDFDPSQQWQIRLAYLGK